MFFLSSCGDFKRARSKRIVEKAFEHFDNEEFEKAKEAAELASRLGSEDWRLFEIRARLFSNLDSQKRLSRVMKRHLTF